MADVFQWLKGHWSRLLGPATNGQAVDVSSTDVTLTQPSRQIYVGGAGNLTVHMAEAGVGDLTFAAVPAGTTLDIRVDIIRHTGTLASNILALW